MNADAAFASSEAGSLPSFYNYKKTYDASNIWIKLPVMNYTFVNTTNPYEDEFASPELEQPFHATSQYHRLEGKDAGAERGDHSRDLHSNALEVLSEVAVSSPQQESTFLRSLKGLDNHSELPFEPASSSTNLTATSSSPQESSSHDHTSNSHQNAASGLNSPIDPDLSSPSTNNMQTSSSQTGRSPASVQTGSLLPNPTLDREDVFLLQHFSKLPGHWMDLFDSGLYFSMDVPRLAQVYPLLKHCACAYAAKQLYQAGSQKNLSGNTRLEQTTVENDSELMRWDVDASAHYDRAVVLLQELLKELDRNEELTRANRELYGLTLDTDTEIDETGQMQPNTGAFQADVQDVAFAASTILGVYEFVSATGTAWSTHLDGCVALLTRVEPTLGDGLNLDQDFMLPTPSNARKAAFWQLARQDYLAAFINESGTRLQPENLPLWQRHGLTLDENGFVISNDKIYDHRAQECMSANALVWLSSKICNFIAMGEGYEPIPPGDRSRTAHVHLTPNYTPQPQSALLHIWQRLDKELTAWFSGLPLSFKSPFRTRPQGSMFEEHERESARTDKKRTFEQVWFPQSWVAATMAHYHMARILLLLNKPHESTARRSTLGTRFESMTAISEETVRHCYQIIGISLTTPDSAAFIHLTQPLFVAGHCLTNTRERLIVIDHLRAIQRNLGWSTDDRLQQLYEQWGWRQGRPPTA